MMSRIGHAVAAMAGAALLLASAPANAAGCWAKEDAAVAAKVRELQTMLMVGALRCRATGIDILPSYNAFVSTHRKTIAAMNDRLKAHFASSGPTEGQSITLDAEGSTVAGGRSIAGYAWALTSGIDIASFSGSTD